MDGSTLSVMTLCLAIGALVQSTLGFGMGVVAIPLLVSAGFSLPVAISALLPNVLVQTAFACWRNREHLPWTDAGPISVLRNGALPVGILVLGWATDRGEAMSRGLLGIALIVILVMQQFRTSTGATGRSSRLEMAAAGLSSGFLAGMIGMGGPPLVLWSLRQNWGVHRQRCFLWLSFLLVIPLQMAIMAWRFGPPWAHATVVGLVSIPFVLIVTGLSGVWADGWSKHRLRKGMRLFLLMIAARLVWQWVSGITR